MPLKIEVGNDDAWQEIGTLGPNDRPGSISDNRSPREVYLFKCGTDDSHSRLLRSKAGVDVERLDLREVHTTGFDVVTILRKGQSHEISIIDRRGSPGKVRFTHV